jgi:hypothetical protein
MVTSSQSDPVIAIPLGMEERRSLSRRHPEMAGYASATLIVAMPEVDEYVSEAIGAMCTSLTTAITIMFDRLVEEHLAKRADLKTEQAVIRQAQFRYRVINDVGAYTAAELAERYGSKAMNRSKLATNWLSEHRVFAVTFNGRNLFLSFQFDANGRPLQGVRAVLRVLKGWTDWEIAAWFLRPNAQLHHETPAEVLAMKPDFVFEVAETDARRRRSLGSSGRSAPEGLQRPRAEGARSAAPGRGLVSPSEGRSGEGRSGSFDPPG